MASDPSPPRSDDLSALDQLIAETRAYRTGTEYQQLLEFIGKMPRVSPYNAFLLHTQNPGVTYVATPGQWRERFRRHIVDGARPLVTLIPFGPVSFVYDVVETIGPPLPEVVTNPFLAPGAVPTCLWDMTVGNCARDLIKVVDISLHTNNAGKIGPAEPGDKVWAVTGKDRNGKLVWGEVPARYRLRFNSNHLPPTRYATLVHELAHLYCGHLGTPDKKWWPDRSGLGRIAEEFEAESVAYLICRRLNIDNPSARYLAGYLGRHDCVPEISLECVLKATHMIEQMGREKTPPRKLDPNKQ